MENGKRENGLVIPLYLNCGTITQAALFFQRVQKS